MATEYERVFLTAVEGTTQERAADAVPQGWNSPAELLAELAGVVGIRNASLTCIPRVSATPDAEIWLANGVSYRSLSPAARFMAELNRPVLLSPGLSLDQRLRPLLHRPDSTSSILIPVHWTRQGTSVVELWTTAEDEVVLGPAELSRTLRFLTSPDEVRAIA